MFSSFFFDLFFLNHRAESNGHIPITGHLTQLSSTIEGINLIQLIVIELNWDDDVVRWSPGRSKSTISTERGSGQSFNFRSSFHCDRLSTAYTFLLFSLHLLILHPKHPPVRPKHPPITHPPQNTTPFLYLHPLNPLSIPSTR